jgi:hypothetical protein
MRGSFHGVGIMGLDVTRQVLTRSSGFHCCFQYYRCILLIPDIYNKQHVKELVHMILMKMGFAGTPEVPLTPRNCSAH